MTTRRVEGGYVNAVALSSGRTWEVHANGLVRPSGHLLKAGCHHRRGTSACGGCYARVVKALDLILKQPEEAELIVHEVHAAMRAELKGRKR